MFLAKPSIEPKKVSVFWGVQKGWGDLGHPPDPRWRSALAAHGRLERRDVCHGGVGRVVLATLFLLVLSRE